MSVDDLDARLMDVMRRCISPLNARVLFDRARRSTSIERTLLDADLPRFVDAIGANARLFLRGPELDRMLDEIRALASTEPIEPRVVDVSREEDISVARLLAREICQRLAGRSLSSQKIATSVSELARNIVSYTPGGRITLTPVSGTPPRIHVLAEDRGSGIPNLDDIFAGRYRSRTGLGKGLLAVKRLADRFEIKTGSGGTRIEVEATL